MTDEQTAAAIVAGLEQDRCGIKLQAAIVAALAEVRMKATGQATQRTIDAAFREGYQAAIDRNANAAVLKMCHEARMMNGIVDYSDPNATGRVRRVLGKLPVTADGCVVGDGSRLFSDCGLVFTHVVTCSSWASPPIELDGWYSTREAAEAAKEAKK